MEKLVDHLFRHQYGKMIAVLTKLFGLAHIELIEDSVQDTFVKASVAWRKQIPENPEAWLMLSAKNRTIDLFRQVKSEKQRIDKFSSKAFTHQLNEIFLDHEVEDSQLRMIFVACHPSLSPEERIAFSLKTISGFSMSEIASALLTKEETIKKRLIRARKRIISEGISFDFPAAEHVNSRLSSVGRVIYLIFNEGFHSLKTARLIDKEMCGEALRLCQLLLKKEQFRSGETYSLFALLCFHSARLESKMNHEGKILSIEHQDRSLWYQPLIDLGKNALRMSFTYEDHSLYSFEAQIALEHLKSDSFQSTDWRRILQLYSELNMIYPSHFNLLNMSVVHLQLGQLSEAKRLLDKVDESSLEQRSYLLDGTYSDYYQKAGNTTEASNYLKKAISKAKNEQERLFLIQKHDSFNLN